MHDVFITDVKKIMSSVLLCTNAKDVFSSISLSIWMDAIWVGYFNRNTWKVGNDHRNISSHIVLDEQWTSDSNDGPDRDRPIVTIVDIPIPQVIVKVSSFHHVHKFIVLVLLPWRMNLA